MLFKLMVALILQSNAVMNSEVVIKSADSTVKISIVDSTKEATSTVGTGFFISPDLVLTNFHVIIDKLADPNSTLTINHKEEILKNLKIIKFSTVNDLALIKIENYKTEDYIDLKKKPTDLEVGSKLQMFGFPSTDVLSRIEGYHLLANIPGYNIPTSNWLITKRFYHGLSGGPVLQEDGSFIGISTSIGDYKGFYTCTKKKKIGQIVSRNVVESFLVGGEYVKDFQFEKQPSSRFFNAKSN
jgi:S1-C subfamily serine protease